MNDLGIVSKDAQYLYVEPSHNIKQLLCDKQVRKMRLRPVSLLLLQEPGHMKARCVLKYSLEEPEYGKTSVL